MNSSGSQLVVNNGQFDSEVIEVFCPDGTGCDISATVNISHSSSVVANDGIITINTSSGLSPFQYSIDGGQTFLASNTFSDLAPGVYNIFVQGATGSCTYQETVTVEACELTTADITWTDVPSVVSTSGSIEITPTSGQGPYMYSIDGGQNFETSNIFTDLPVGTYNVVVMDESNICVYEEEVPIVVEGLGLNNDVLAPGIMIYPNPTKNDFSIEIESVSALSEAVIIEVYDNLGRTIQAGSITKDSNGKTTMSLNGYVSGTYFIKCFNNSFEKHFKVVKI